MTPGRTNGLSLPVHLPHLNLFPDEPAAGDNAPEEKKAAKPPADEHISDLGRKVKLPDGTVVPLAELVEGHNKVASLAQEHIKLKGVADSARVLFDPNVTKSARADAIRNVLLSNGRDPAAVEQYLEESGLVGADPDDAGPAVPNAEMAQIRKDLQDLRTLVDTQQKGAVDTNAKILRRQFDDVVGAAAASKDVNELVARVKASKGEEAAEAFRDKIRAQIKRDAYDLMNQRRDRGDLYDDPMDWIKPATKEAAAAIVDTYRTAIGDTNKVGRSSGTDSGFEKLLSSKPVEAPSFSKKGQKSIEVKQQLDDYTKDAIQRTFAEALSEDLTKV